jgi:hypothetical protein
MQINFGTAKSALLEVYVQDFGDNYHRFNDEPSSELEREARRIRRRYKDITDFLKAVTIYNEYMSLLAKKYGGVEILKLKIKYNQVTEFIPPKPGLKLNELNKFSLKNNIIISKRRSYDINEETLDKIENLYVPENEKNKEGVVRVFGSKNVDKKKKKIVKKLIRKGEIKSSRKISLKNISNSIEFLEEYFRTKNSGNYKKESDDTVFSLSDYCDGTFAKKLRDTREEEREVVFFRGQYMNKESMDEVSIYRELGKLGWNSVKLMRKAGVSKRISKIFKDEKKKKKKKKKDAYNQDNLIVQLMTDGGYDSFEDFQAEMESFTVADIFK